MIRLACSLCDCGDMDGITPARLAKAIRDGWQDVARVQTDQEATKGYDNPEHAPKDWSVFDWFTHLGICPTCAQDLG